MKKFWKGFILILLLLIFCWCFQIQALAGDNLLPQASFTANPTSGSIPLTVAFDASGSTPGRGTSITNYEWKFESPTDDWMSSGGSSTTTHTYSNSGVYTIFLRVTNNLNQNSVPVTTTITVSPTTPTPTPTPTILSCPDPSVVFTINPSSGSAPLTVNFDSSGTDPGAGETITHYLWTFGDLSLPSNEVNPSHTYLNPGTYQVKLAITNSCNSLGSSERTVTVTEPTPTPTELPTPTPSPTPTPCPTPTAVFTTQISAENPLMVVFDASQSTAGVGANIQDYFWNYGDGTSQHLQQPSTTHTYSTFGTYAATLTVTNNCNQNSASNPIVINLVCRDSTLQGISLSQGKLEPQFNTEVEFYQVDVGYETETITVTPLATCSDLSIEIADIAVPSGNASPPIPLEVGINTIRITIFSQEGEILKSYILNVRRSAPSDTSLLFNDLTIDPNPFSPAWSPKEKDITKIGGKLNREIPLIFRFYSGEDLVDTTLPKEINRYSGGNVATTLPDRFQWNGFHNQPLPSGLYDVKVSTPVRLNRQTGTLRRDWKGILFEPQALAVDDAGNLVIASHGFPIQVFRPSGEFVRFLGKEKVYNALAFTPQGKLIGLGQNRLFQIDPNGLEETILCDLKDFGISIDYQDGLAVSSQGEIFVGCQSRGSVLVFSQNGSLLRELKVIENTSSYNEVHELALGPDDRLYVTLTEFQNGMLVGMIKIFSPDGILTQTITNIYGGGPIPMPALGAIGVFADGSILVATSQPFPPLQFSGNDVSPDFNYFCKLSPQGQLLASWGKPGEFCRIGRMVIKNDICYVTDQDGFHRMVAMDGNGRILSTLSTSPDTFRKPVGMARLDQNRLVLLDNALERLVVMKNDGTVELVIPIWAYFNEAEQVQGVYTSPDGFIYLPGFNQVVSITPQGRLQKIIPLEVKTSDFFGWGGLLVDHQGNLILTERYPGKIWIFDPNGHLLRTIFLPKGLDSSANGKDSSPSWPERPGFFGPIISASEDGIYVQMIYQDQKGKFTPAFCELDLKTDKVRTFISRNLDDEMNLVIPRMDYSIEDDLVTPFAVGKDYFYKVYFHSVVAYDRLGNFQWSLGQEPGWSFSIPWLLANQDYLEIMEFETTHSQPGPIRIENWSVNQDVLLAQGQVEIDNIPPRVTIDSGGMVTVNKEKYTLGGDIEEKIFDHYGGLYRKAGSERGWNTVDSNVKLRPQQGILASWFVGREYRDTGIEVKVVAWDTAGNSSESTAQVAFDDDGDGLSNREELALGTDPRQFSQIEIQTDLKTLVNPYFFANAEHELHFYVVDVSNPDRPRPLPNAHLEVSFDTGVYSQSQDKILWQSPNVDSQTVTVSCVLSRIDQTTLSEGETGNLLTADFQLLVMRDEDRDWMPDLREISADNDNLNSTFLNNPDSDGDGVIDGKDLAPRTTYQECWQKVYYPGMLGKTIPLCFYGIGGVGSHTVRYYFVEDEHHQKRQVTHDLGREGIIESDVSSIQKNKELVNSMLFPGQTGDFHSPYTSTLPNQNLLVIPKNGNQFDTPSWNSIKNQLKEDFDNLVDIEIPTLPSENQTQSHLKPPSSGKGEPTPPPFAITSFEGNTLQTSPEEEYLGMHEFTIKKAHEEFVDFYYYSNTAVANGVVNNVDPIDVSTFPETGIHLGYMVVKVPGSNEYSDRTLTLQWRIDAEMDETRLPSYPGDGFTKMVWLVEVYHPSDVILRPGNVLILTNPSSTSGSAQKSGPILPWNKVLYSDQVFAQSQGDHLYYASVILPGEYLTPGNAFFIKLTPFWVKKSGTKIAFEPLKLPPMSSQIITLGEGRSVLAFIQEPPYLPITVSGIIIETMSPVQEWIHRLTPRPNHPLNDTILDQLVKAVTTSSHPWPPNLGSYDYSRTVNGVNYTIRCINTIGMRNQWKRGGLEPTLKDSIQRNSLDSVDVVCFIAPNQHERSLLYQSLPWGSNGEWLLEGESLTGEGTTLSSSSFNLSEETSMEQVSSNGSSADPLLEQLKKVKNLVSSGMKIYSSYKTIAKAQPEEDTILTSWFELGDETLSEIDQLQTLTMQKGESGRIIINQKTTDVRSSPEGTLNRVKEKSEVVDEAEVNQSSLLNQMQNSIQFKTFLVGAKIGTIIISNGSQIYTCSSKDDWVGVTVYTLKGGVELSSEVFKLAGIAAQTRLGSYLPSYLVMPEKSFWVKGIPVKSIGGSLNVVGIIAGTIETGYNVYLYTKADDVLTKKEAARNTCATAIDAGISVIEPLGGLVMGFWVIGSEIVHLTLKLFDVEVSPYIKKVTSSPGQFLTYTLVKIDPKSVPFDKAVDAYTKAQKDAIEKCKKYNRDPKRQYIYIFVPPD